MDISKPLRLALVGNPNCGKTALFNRLTGARQKVANYAGVTVERKVGLFCSAVGRQYQILDLPGAYSLNALTPDEAVTRDVLFGARADEALPDVIVLVVDATNLRLNLRLVLEVLRLKRPTVLALNMVDLAKKRGIVIDIEKLRAELGIPVIETVAVKPGGTEELVKQLDALQMPQPAASHILQVPALDNASDPVALEATLGQVRRILDAVVKQEGQGKALEDRIDAVVLHPLWGYVILAVLLFLIFQAVFSWSQLPMDLIKSGVDGIGKTVQELMPEGVLRSLIVDGVLSGVGSVLVFLPQILILFLFILTLEDSGYLPRAAFLLDRLMGGVGLSGRAFIPLLSSFACAIPGGGAARAGRGPRGRRAAGGGAPLMTCAARGPGGAGGGGAGGPRRAGGGGGGRGRGRGAGGGAGGA